jgi:hypothetical protein
MLRAQQVQQLSLEFLEPKGAEIKLFRNVRPNRNFSHPRRLEYYDNEDKSVRFSLFWYVEFLLRINQGIITLSEAVK